MKKSAAFTLIELLVVIVIIAILAGIALPVFSRVLERGRITQDCSNLRQLGIGTVAYLNDNNDTMFNTTSTGQDSNNHQLGPPGLLEVNYVPNPKAFQSPFDKRPSGSPNPLSYGVNSNVLNPAGASPVWDGNVTKLVAASQLIWYAVSYKGDPINTSSWMGWDNVGLAVPSGGTGMTVGTQQSGKWLDVLYGDMHVASIKLTDFQRTDDQSGSGGIDGINQWQPLGHPSQ